MTEIDAERFKSNADECRHLAADAISEDDRQAWLRLAAEWDKLSEHARHCRGIFDRYE
ncbi:hypothetical protein [Bradyrhizobium sp. CCGUVB14]|uniref:hypothetical protein n=1 Tax=Bradyrhizobium sp. CCGUVB14 TaxID=2949628 RepID=UPI0020B2026E|nr:hypothetical protein [Bradyrhizobium sp. CCGUVB14]MCP3442318.1 hypothetical protein [Bradyrhizobium sp. CCGUVB14]